MATDFFRPHNAPARVIYDAFMKEAALRNTRTVEDWIEKEPKAVWGAARDYAQQHGLTVPTLEQVNRAEQSARGHSDYGAKWAYRVSELLVPL